MSLDEINYYFTIISKSNRNPWRYRLVYRLIPWLHWYFLPKSYNLKLSLA